MPKEILIKMLLGVESPINDVEVQDIVNGFNSLNIDITTADFEATLNLDAEENLEYQAKLMEEADELLKEQDSVVLEKHEDHKLYLQLSVQIPHRLVPS